MSKEKAEDGNFELKPSSWLINKKYQVIGKVGSGSYSTVHAVQMMKGGRSIVRAVKVESQKTKQPQISTEVSVYNLMKLQNPDEIGFGRLYEFGFESDFHYLIMTLLGPSIEQLMRLCGGNFSLKTTLIIALQVLDRIETLHSNNYVHCDIKPDNFLIGLGSGSQFVYMVDFGKCKRYKNKHNNQHIHYKENCQSSFNPIFSSMNIHNGIQYSRRDDLESLIYMIIYMKNGKLPWFKPVENKTVINISKKNVTSEEIKKKITPQMLCHKMPLQIINLMYYVNSIEFYEKPDYEFFRKNLYICLEREQTELNIIYDWNLLEDIDFKVYVGEPKIVQRIASQNQVKSSIVQDFQEDTETNKQKLIFI